MLNIYTLQRIVRTADPAIFRYIFADGYEQREAATWGGFWRGSIAGFDANGEYERRTHEYPPDTFSDVMGNFLAGGGEIEDADPEAEAAFAASQAAKS